MITSFLILVSLLIYLVPFTVPLIYFGYHNRSWIPIQTGRSVVIRRFESLVLLLVLACFGMLWLYQGVPTALVPQRLSNGLSPILQGYYRWAVCIGVIAGLQSVVVAWRASTTIAIAALMLFGIVGSVVLQGKISHQRQHEWELAHSSKSDAKAKQELSPVKLRFEMIDNLVGADLWINETYLGKTPYETTDQELLTKVAQWDQKQINETHNSSDPANTFLAPDGARIRRWGWCPLHFIPHNDLSTQLYYRVDWNGMAGYSTLVQQHSVGPAASRNSSIVIQLDTVFPAWEVAIEELLDRARVSNYEVDAAWLDAFNSYGAFGTNRLQRCIVIEPAFEKVRQTRARAEHKLHEITSSAMAWTRLMQIESEARRKRQYDSASSAGIAVDLLVPLLDVNQLLSHASELLKATSRPDPGGMSYRKDQFATVNDQAVDYGDTVGLWPIAQAVWRLDQKWDAESARLAETPSFSDEEINKAGLRIAIDPLQDNLVEQKITPVLMQLSYLNPSRLSYAAILGGSTYEAFLLRNDWRSPPDRVGGLPFIGEHQNSVNPWFHKLLLLRSPLGKAFRQQQARQVLSLSRNGLSEFALRSGSFPNDMDFLFLDREFTAEKPSLGMQFWPEVNLWAESAPGHARNEILKLRWDYLARLWPESTPAMFVDAFQKAISNQERMSSPHLPDVLPADAQFDILQAVLAAEVARVAKLPADPKDKEYSGPKYLGGQTIVELKTKLEWTPCEANARLLMAELTSDPKHPAWARLPGLLSANTRHEDLLRMLAESGQAKLQLLILPAIEQHPTPERRELLELLLKAKDEQVRTASAAVHQRLLDLLKRPLPHRKLPDVAESTPGTPSPE